MEHLIIDKLYLLLGYIPGNSRFDPKILANPDRAKKILDRPAHEFFQEFFKDTKFSENSVLPDPIARLCAERFLTEKRGHRFWPPSSSPDVPVWPGHRIKILEAMKNIFAKKFYSQTIKTYASQQPQQRKRQKGLKGITSSNRPKKRQRRSSFHEITELAGIPSWNEGPKSPEPLTCANYVRSLRPEPDEIHFTMAWLDDKEAAWPESADAPLQRLMHDENFYIGHSWDDLGDEFREVYVALREGTEIDHPEAHQYNEFRRRVNNRVQKLTRKLLDDPFRILTDQAGSVEKSKLFRRKWQHKQAYWEVRHSDSEFSDSGPSEGQRTTKMPEPAMAPEILPLREVEVRRAAKDALASMAAKADHSYMAHQEYWGTPESHSVGRHMHLSFSPLTMTQATPSRSHTHVESSSPLSRLSSIDTVELESPQHVHANQSFGIENSPQPSLHTTLPIASNGPTIGLASIDKDLPSTFISEQNSFNANSTLSNTPVAPRARCENNEHPASITAALNKSVSNGLDHEDDDYKQLPSPLWVYYTTPKEKDPPSLRFRTRSTFSQIRAALQTSPQGQALWQSIEDDHTISSERWACCLRRLVNTISVQRLGPVNHARECVNRLNNEIIKRLNAPNSRILGYKTGLRQRDVIAALELLKSGGEDELVVLELDSSRRRMLQLQYGPSGLLEEGLDFSRPFPQFGPSTVPEARDRIQDPDGDTAMQSDLNEGDIVVLGCEHSRIASAASQNVNMSETAPPVDFDPNVQGGSQQLLGGNIHATKTHEKTPDLPSRSASKETAPPVNFDPNLHTGYQQLPGGNMLATTTQEKTPELLTMSASTEQEAVLKEVADQHQLDTPDNNPTPEPPRVDKPTESISQGEPLLSIQSSPQNQNDATQNTPQEVGPQTSRPYSFIPKPDLYTSSRSNSDVLPTPADDRLIKTYDPHNQNLVLIIDDASGNLDQVYPFQVYMKDSTLEEFFSFYSRISGTPFDRIKRLDFGMMFGPTERRRTLKVPRFNGEAAWMRLKEWAATLFEEAKLREGEKMEFAFMVQHVRW